MCLLLCWVYAYFINFASHFGIGAVFLERRMMNYNQLTGLSRKGQEISLVLISVLIHKNGCIYGWFMVFNAIFNNISVMSWRLALLVEETVENHRPVKSLTIFITSCCIQYTSPWTGFELTTLVVMGTDCTGSCKANYHTITTTTTSGVFMIILIIQYIMHNWMN